MDFGGGWNDSALADQQDNPGISSPAGASSPGMSYESFVNAPTDPNSGVSIGRSTDSGQGGDFASSLRNLLDPNFQKQDFTSGTGGFTRNPDGSLVPDKTFLEKVQGFMPPKGVQAAGMMVPGAGVLMGLQAFLRAMGFEGTVDENQVGLGAFGGEGRQPEGAPYRAPAGMQGSAAFSPKAAVNMPDFLKNDLSGLSPFQQRAAISTYGTSSESGRYRAPETIDYYRSLAEKTLRNEMGIPIGSPLPIEWQYMREVLGSAPQETTDAFLQALAGYSAPA